MKLCLSFALIACQLLLYSQEYPKSIYKKTIVTLYESPDSTKLRFIVKTEYEIPKSVDICIESTPFHVDTDHFHYYFFVNGKQVQRRGKYPFNDSTTSFSKLLEPLSTYTGIDKPNTIVSINDAWIDKKETTSYQLILEEAPLCIEDFIPSKAVTINWDVFCQSNARYTPIMRNEDVRKYIPKIYPRHYPGMDSTMKYFPLLQVKGVTSPYGYQPGDQLMRIFFQNDSLANTMQSEATISIQENTISVAYHHKMELRTNIYYMSSSIFEEGMSSIFPDVDLKMIINKEEVDINLAENDEFDKIKRNLSGLESPVYTIRFSEHYGEPNRIEIVTPKLARGDNIETIFSNSYESDENFKEELLSTKFTYRNTCEMDFGHYNEIAFRYPEGQVLIDFDTPFCRHIKSERLLIYRYPDINDVPVWISFAYEDKDALFYRVCRVVNPVLTGFLIAMIIHLYIRRRLIPRDAFIKKFRNRLSAFTGITQSVYLATYFGIKSNFGYFEGLGKSLGWTLIIGAFIFTVIYYVENDKVFNLD